MKVLCLEKELFVVAYFQAREKLCDYNLTIWKVCFASFYYLVFTQSIGTNLHFKEILP